jgi:hypothetical protein
MLSMVTFTINIPQMLAYIYIPYMDPLGYIPLYRSSLEGQICGSYLTTKKLCWVLHTPWMCIPFFWLSLDQHLVQMSREYPQFLNGFLTTMNHYQALGSTEKLLHPVLYHRYYPRFFSKKNSGCWFGT